MLLTMNENLTRRDVLMQLRRLGVTKLSELKVNCRDFEQYMAVNYDYEIIKRERPDSESMSSKTHLARNSI